MGAYLFEDEVLHQPALEGVELDRIGRGDAFGAGFIWGYLQRNAAYGLECGVALAALQQTYLGDFTWSTRAELLSCLRRSAELER